jgi:hypothetical protein
MSADPTPPPPDDKDWTWVLREPCPDCGFDAHAISYDDVPSLARTAAGDLATALSGGNAAMRPAPGVWSALEYACHVEDVCATFSGRLHRMLTEDDPQFANWDQDATALERRYWEQDPVRTADALTAAADRIAASFSAVAPADQSRSGRRSDGAVFTVDTLARYFVHDLIHHVHDVTTHAF